MTPKSPVHTTALSDSNHTRLSYYRQRNTSHLATWSGPRTPTQKPIPHRHTTGGASTHQPSCNSTGACTTPTHRTSFTNLQQQEQQAGPGHIPTPTTLPSCSTTKSVTLLLCKSIRLSFSHWRRSHEANTSVLFDIPPLSQDQVGRQSIVLTCRAPFPPVHLRDARQGTHPMRQREKVQLLPSHDTTDARKETGGEKI